VKPCIILHYAEASQRHNSAELASEYLLLDPNAFESRKVAFFFLLTEIYRQAMLTDASQDNTLAQAARVATADRVAITPKTHNPRRFRFSQGSEPFQQTPR
jgi:hypothetical protein